jgi:transcriptional regulator with PAS, ATPase and Fis domain
VKQGQMRMDLYFRLNILRIHIPPLRERKEDIPILVASFLEHHSQYYGKKIDRLPGKLMKRFLAYSWPGNIRELQNLIERFVIMIDSPDKNEEILDLLFEECRIMERALFEDSEMGYFLPEAQRNQFEDSYKKKAVAKMMGVSRTTLWRRLKAIDNTR